MLFFLPKRNFDFWVLILSYQHIEYYFDGIPVVGGFSKGKSSIVEVFVGFRWRLDGLGLPFLEILIYYGINRVLCYLWVGTYGIVVLLAFISLFSG